MVEQATTVAERPSRKGMIAVLVVLGVFILLALSVKKTVITDVHSAVTRVQAGIEQYKVCLLMYQSSNGVLPTTEQGLKALIAKPVNDPHPKNWRQIMEAPLLDPWNHEYLYLQPGVHHPRSYDLYSAGPDGQPGTADDLGNWQNAQ